MGMFDTFELIKPIKCVCGMSLSSFQTKSLDKLMDVYKQGEKAQAYYLRELSEEEEKQKKERMDKEYPGMYGTPFGNLCGCFILSNGVRSIVPDGEYDCYTACSKCKDWVEAVAIIKNGIFTKIKIISTREIKGEV
jgi:hypothetical protein